MDGYIVAVFRTREQTMRFNLEMAKKGYRASIINTPRDITSACGISAKFNGAALSYARYVVRCGDFSTFAGFYEYDGRRYIFIM
jgi:hypothetical protein